LSKLWYTLAVVTMPDSFIKEIQRACINFLWNGGANLVHIRQLLVLNVMVE